MIGHQRPIPITSAYKTTGKDVGIEERLQRKIKDDRPSTKHTRDGSRWLSLAPGRSSSTTSLPTPTGAFLLHRSSRLVVLIVLVRTRLTLPRAKVFRVILLELSCWGRALPEADELVFAAGASKALLINPVTSVDRPAVGA